MRFRFLPILTVIVLGLGIPWLSGELVDFARHYSHLVPSIADRLGWLYASQGVQLVLALIAILCMKWLVPGDYGLHWPAAKSYVLPALLIGALFGAAMKAVEMLPNVLAHVTQKPPAGSLLSWLIYNGLYLGPTEEVLYRALLVTYLGIAMPGKVRLGRYEMNGAGIVVAVVFALTSMVGLLNQPFWVMGVQALIYLLLGVLFAYWQEKSKSVLAPIVGHSAARLAGLGVVLLASANAFASSS